MEAMENIMENENAIEAAEEIAETSRKGFKLAAGIGIAAIVGIFAYKYAYKPIKRKIEEKRSERHTTVTPVRVNPNDVDEVDETYEE